MATNSNLLPYLSLLFLIVFTGAPSLAKGSGDGDDEPTRGAPLIREVCRDTDHYDLCVSSLVSRPGSSEVLFKDLGPLVVGAALDSAVDTRHQIKAMMRGRLNPAGKWSLVVCGKYYQLVVYNLRLAQKYMKSSGFKQSYDYSPVEGWVRYSQGYLDKCGATLKKRRGVGAPLKQRNEMARQLADNAFVIVGDLMV